MEPPIFTYAADPLEASHQRLQAEHGEMYAVISELLLLVEDFSANLKTCVLQDYKRLNDAPIRAREILARADD